MPSSKVKHTPISAVEKYEDVGKDRPRCECHGELKAWQRRVDLPAGGTWRCAVRHRETSASAQDPEVTARWRKNNVEKIRETNRKYFQKRYNEDPEFRIRKYLRRRRSEALKIKEKNHASIEQLRREDELDGTLSFKR